MDYSTAYTNGLLNCLALRKHIGKFNLETHTYTYTLTHTLMHTPVFHRLKLYMRRKVSLEAA